MKVAAIHEYDFEDQAGTRLVCLLCREHRIIVIFNREPILRELLLLGLLRGRAKRMAEELGERVEVHA